MANVETFRLKPNPSGKDRTRWSGASATQLGGEWADIKCVGTQAVNLNGLALYHIAYRVDGSSYWENVMAFSGTLPAGQVMRVHAGSGPESVLLPVDKAGADIHLFTRGNYVWNNDRGDCAGLLLDNGNLIDKACYDSKPPEGVVLERVGDRLLPLTTGARGYR